MHVCSLTIMATTAPIYNVFPSGLTPHHNSSNMPKADIDIDQIPVYTSSHRTWHAICEALSHAYNPSNHEDAYYPAYFSTFIDLLRFDFNGVLMPRSKANVCLSSAERERQWLASFHARAIRSITEDPVDMETGKDTDAGGEDEDESEGEDESEDEKKDPSFFMTVADEQPVRTQPSRKAVDPPELIARLQQEAQKAERVLAKEAMNAFNNLIEEKRGLRDAVNPDMSFSSDDTVPDGGVVLGVPDFLFCHSYLVKEPKPRAMNRLYSWKARGQRKVAHECFPFFAENKTSPRRHKPNSASGRIDWNNKRGTYFEEAYSELVFYLALYFARDLHAASAIAFAACGLHWKWVEFKREEIPKVSFGEGKSIEWDDLVLRSKALDRLADAPMFMLATEASDTALNVMRRALVDILNSHTSYSPTMLHPTNKGKGKEQARSAEDLVEATESWEEDNAEDDEADGGMDIDA
ncbi:hypothetical protein HGRIS_003249 [Hohenbuehelia grisea]|uniref:Uncharacterized protein n=1 Tax=Hohenbuehelia grisea TaxID=104357 RepID=A0ABR3JNS6_9AGAR